MKRTHPKSGPNILPRGIARRVRKISGRTFLANPLRVLSSLIAALALTAMWTPTSEADTLTFQQGVGGYTGLSQTTLFQFGTAAGQVNGGLATGTWTVDGGSAAFNDGQFKQGLIRFDNVFGSSPGQIPLGSTITSATLTATFDDVSNSAFSVYRMLQTWSPATATWNSFAAGVQNDGVEAVAAASASVSNPNGNAAGNYNPWGTGLTADLQMFSNGTSNFGWVVLPTSGNAGWGWSAGNANTPVLSVTFTPPATTLAAAITSPANNATVGATFTITATATAASPATVASVTFKDGAATLGVDTTSPYSFTVTGAALGSHVLTALVTDSTGATAISSPVNVTVVNLPPIVSLTSPTEGSSFTAGTNVTLDATASDDVAVTNVEFFVDNVSIGSDSTAPYSATWNNVPLGAHVLKAVATDGTNSTTSTLVNVSVTSFGALQFDGVNDYVTMGTATALGAQNFTLECWIKHDPSGTGRTTASSGTGGINIFPLISKGRGEADGSNVDCNYVFGLQTDGRLAADFEDLNSGLNHPIVGTGVVPSNVWKHVAVTYDGSFWRIYIDGVLDSSQQVTGGANIQVPRYDSIQHFGLGTAMTSTGATQGFYKGVMDEVRVWNVARTQGEIQSAMNSEVVSATGLLGRWSLNETSGTTATNTGTATNVNGNLTNGPVRTTGYPFGPQPPTVAITSPANNSTVGTSFTIDATASDADGTVTSVSFYDGITLLGTDTSSPYSYTWNGAPVGSHSLTAVALDNSNASTTSAAVNVTVSSNTPPVITLTAPANQANITTSSTTVSASIADPEGDAQTVTFYGRETAPASAGPDFTFIAIPDTQYYSEDTGRNPGAPSNSGAHISYFNDQTQWITNSRITRNIAFVAHMGDMVQNGDSIQAQWVRADGAMQLIENPLTTLLTHGIPWGGAPGNHDFGTGGGSGSTTYWNQYFGTARWSGRTYFRGNYGVDNNNNYQFFSAGGLDFIVINLAYRTSADTAVHDWADALLKAYPNRRAIVTSHWIIGTGNPASFGGQGQAIYDNLKDNPNLFLLLCGHIHGEGRRSDVFQGRTVHTILQDYQDAANGGNGFLRTLSFSPSNNQITAEIFSPTLNRTSTTADVPTALGTFTLPYNMQGAVTDWIPLGTVNVPANGTTASLAWTGLEPGKNYEWHATTNDGVHTVASATRRFTTSNGMPPTCAITSPANNSAFYTPATVNITASASDPDGSIAKVEFFNGATKLAEDTSSPFEFTATGLTVGGYTLTAVATDNLNNATISAGVAITVSVPPTSGTLTRGPYLNQNNQNSIVVRWRSSQSIVGRVRYGNSPTNLTNTVDEASTATDHVVQLTGLAPYTRYYYSIGSAFDTLAGGDANHTFRTSPTPGTATDTRIWVVGDCGRGSQFQRDVRDAYYSWTGTRAPDLCLMLGDNAYNSGTDAEYQTGFFDIYPTMFRKMPLWSTLGNHDANNGSTSPTANFPYFDMFTFPTAAECGGVASGTERYFSFDYGNIHVINLDSQTSSRNTIEMNGSDGPMAAWLRFDLASTTKTWIIAIFHHPPYSKGSHNSDTETQMVQMRTNFGPILEAGGVDAVLVGHSHAYERSMLIDGHYGISTTLTNDMKLNAGSGRPTGSGAYIKPLTGPKDHFGTVYTVAGSAGSADGGSLNHPVMYVSYNTGGTLNLDINGSRLDATYIEKGATSGSYTTPDTFTIIKQGAADSDGDGIPDEYEIANGLDRFNSADAALDKDGDGISNLLEFAFCTNPSVSSTGLLQYGGTFGNATFIAPGQPRVAFESTPNGIDFRAIFMRRTDHLAGSLTYTPQFSADALAPWVASTEIPTVIAADGTCQIVSVPYPPFVNGKKARFFRISVSTP